jgi:O-antigen/teichoic acid export membrane protein
MISIAYALFCRFLEVLFGILILILTSRLFGVEGRGLFTAGMVVAGLFATLCSINFSRGLYADICSCGKRVDDYVKKQFLTIVMLVITTSSLGILAYFLAYLYGVKLFANMPLVLVLLFALYLPSLIWINVANVVYSSIGIMTIKNNIALLMKIIFSLTAALLYFAEDLSLVMFCGIFVLFSIITMIVEGALLRHRYSTENLIDLSSIKRLTQKSLAWYPDLVGGYMISGAASTAVVYYLSVKEVGIFGIAMQIFSIGFMLVPTVLQLYLSENIAKYGPEKSIKIFLRYVAYYSIYFIFSYLVLNFAGMIAIEILLGREFIDAVSLLKIMAIAGWISGVLLLIAPLWTAMNYVKFATINTMALGAISFFVLTFMISQYGLYGAAWAMVIIYVIALIGNIFLFNYTIKNFASK